MSKKENSDINILGQVMQEAVLTFGATLLIYLGEKRSDAMNAADERFAAEDFEGARYWNGRADMVNELIALLQPLANGD